MLSEMLAELVALMADDMIEFLFAGMTPIHHYRSSAASTEASDM
jgi:hypothetical protein